MVTIPSEKLNICYAFAGARFYAGFYCYARKDAIARV